MNQDKNTDGYKGNQNAVKHGAEGALRRKNEGKRFTGLAAQVERDIREELEAGGIAELVKRDAIQLQTVSDLYRDAAFKAAQDGDYEALDRYVKRYGWLAGLTLRAWAQVKADDKEAERGGVSAEVVLESLKRERNEKAE